MSISSDAKENIQEHEGRKFLLEFIETYKSLPFLWDRKLKEYSDRSKKSQQLIVLLEKYREKYPDAEKEDVTKKINSLRTCYRRELKRMADARENESEYEPSLWYFNELSFIKDNIHSFTFRRMLQDEEDIQETIEATPVLKKNTKNEPTNELTDPLSLRFENDTNNFKKITDIWVNKIKSMDSIQQLYAEKFINEILFEGVLGNLHRKAVQIVPQSRNNPNSSSLQSRNLKKYHSRINSSKISSEYDHSDLEETYDCKTEIEPYFDTDSD